MIFYFSGTGNSLYVAKKIAAGSDIINIASVVSGKFEDSEIGFVYPVHCGVLPKLVEKFIKESEFRADYIWAVATAGGNEGKSYNHLQSLLKDEKSELNYAACIKMPDNSIAFKTEKAEQARLLGEVDVRIMEIKNDINGRVRKKYSAAYSPAASNAMWFFFKHLYGLNLKNTSSTCVGCGQCVALCPTKNIVINNGRPSFGKNCCYCLACIQWCPTRAISFGRAKPNELTAYTNPTVTVDEMIMRNK